MKLTMLGTGNALVTEYYNTCFVLSEEAARPIPADCIQEERIQEQPRNYFLVDGGGGSMLLHQLKHAGISWKQIHTIFVTHKHIDHLMGIVWMMRMICQYMRQGEYEGEVRLYAHEELIGLLRELGEKLLQKKEIGYLDHGLYFIPVRDGEQCEILGRTVTFFDIHSTKAKQFGFTMQLNEEERLTCCGDEPLEEHCRSYAQGSKWLLHEAFCLHADADRFHPYEKHHSTVKDACELAQSLKVQNLLLYHTEDSDPKTRKARYLAEGTPYYDGNLFIPEDLEELEL